MSHGSYRYSTLGKSGQRTPRPAVRRGQSAETFVRGPGGYFKKRLNDARQRRPDVLSLNVHIFYGGRHATARTKIGGGAGHLTGR